MTIILTTEFDVEAECPTCSADLLCPDCDPADNADLPTHLPTNTSGTLDNHLFDLYLKALDSGRFADKDFIEGLRNWMHRRDA